MKTKLSIVLALFAICLLASCSSSPKKIAFNELESKTFTLNNLFYATIVDETNRDVPEIFATLPLQEAIDLIKTRFGADVDLRLYDENNFNNVKSYNLGMRNYFITHEIEDSQRVSISFTRLNTKDISAEIKLRVFENGSVIATSEITATISCPLNWKYA